MYIPVNIFKSQFNFMKLDLNILLNDWIAENDIELEIKKKATEIIEQCLNHISAISLQLNIVNLESPPAKFNKDAKHIIDKILLINLYDYLETLIKIIPDEKFIGHGKLPNKHFFEFLHMVDSLKDEQKRYFYINHR